MYGKKDTNQLTLSNFLIPFSEKLSSDNRRIKVASIAPREKLENQYIQPFSRSGMGSPAKQFCMAFEALISKEKLNIRDEEMVEQIRGNPYLQYFIGLEEYQVKAPFNPSIMTYFRTIKLFGAMHWGYR